MPKTLIKVVMYVNFIIKKKNKNGKWEGERWIWSKEKKKGKDVWDCSYRPIYNISL